MQILGGGKPKTASGKSPHILDGSDQGFMAEVIETSMTTPVIVDFWAPWCGPCRTLTPALEKAVEAANGTVKLVKINIDEHPGVAGQLRVQSIPTVFAFAGGRPVDGFQGAIPASEVGKFIDRVVKAGKGQTGPGHDHRHGHGPHEVEGLIKRAQDSLKLGDIGGAAEDFAHALQHAPENMTALAGLARCYLLNGELDQAKAILAEAPEAEAANAEIVSVRTAIELAEKAPPKHVMDGLERRLAGDPNDHAARFDLAQGLAAGGRHGAAIDHLLDLIARDKDWNEGAARAELLKVFDAAGPTAAVVKEGRRRLSALLFA